MSEKKIIYGFHSITSRIRLDVNSVKEIYLDESRNDARMNDLLELIKLRNINSVSYTHLTLPTIYSV